MHVHVNLVWGTQILEHTHSHTGSRCVRIGTDTHIGRFCVMVVYVQGAKGLNIAPHAPNLQR